MSTTATEPTNLPFAPIREKLRAALTQYKKNHPEKFVEYDVYQDIVSKMSTKDFLNIGNIDKTLKEQGYQNIAYESLTLLKIAILFESEELVQDILAYGARVNIPDPKDQNGWGGYTELHWAAFVGNAKIAKILVDAGAVINIMATDNYTPLHIAAERGHIEVAKLLIDKGADINVKMWSHKTPLHFAVANNNMEMVKYLLNKHADINAQDKDGNTPLHFAVAKNNMEMARTLIGNGADINIKNCEGHTPKDIAVSNDDTELAEYIGSVEKLQSTDLLIQQDNEQDSSSELPGQEAPEGQGDN